MFHVVRKSRQTIGVAAAALCLLGACALCHADASTSDLIKALGDENRGQRYSAALILGDRGAKEAVEPMIQCLKVENDPSVRIVFALVLHKIGDARAIEALRAMARTDPNRNARHIAATVVADMEKLALDSEYARGK